MKTELSGLIPNLDNEAYHAMKSYVSNSMLSKFLHSPAHLQVSLSEPYEPTPDQQLGTLIHSAVLEPETLERDYVISPKFDKRTKEGKAGSEAFALANAGKKFIDQDTHNVVSKIIEAVYSHDNASAFLMGGITESSIFWVDAETGVKCRARPDYYIQEHGILVDVKSTKDARARDFQRSFSKYGYHRQLAFYARGLKSMSMPVNRYIIIAVEKVAPFGLKVYDIDPNAVAVGDSMISELLIKYAECQKTDLWPVYDQEIETLGLPAYDY